MAWAFTRLSSSAVWEIPEKNVDESNCLRFLFVLYKLFLILYTKQQI